MDNRIVVIATYDNNFEADLAKGLLEENGIDAVVLNEMINSIYSTFAGDMFKLELAVPIDQADQAKELLETYTIGFDTYKILKEERALLEGHFVLTSGRHSAQYIEKIKILQNPEKTEIICKMLVEKLQDYEFDVVIGPAYGGIVLAFEVARLLNLPFVFTQRKDEIMMIRSGFDLHGYKTAVIIEDIVTTGGSVKEVIKCLQTEGIYPVAVACIVDRSGGLAEFSCPLISLLSLSIPSWEADLCELCKKGIEVTKPGSSDKK